MPDQNTPGSHGTSVNLTAAPGGDINFDDLFPIEAESLQTLAPQAPGSNPSVTAPQTPAQEFFIKGKRSVYKTSEDAIKGLDTKDDLIDNYRSFLKTKGIDPDTFQATPAPQAQPAPQSNSPYTYFDNEGKLYEDLARLSRTDPAAWGRTLRQYNQETIAAQVAPILPLLTEVSRQKAIRQVSQEVSDFPTFMGSDSYRETLDKAPILKQAIESAENNFELANTLPQLYQLTYLVAQGRRTPDPVVAAPVATPVQSQPGRPTTTSPSSLTPPQPGVAPDLRTSAGRKTLIADFEGRGGLDRPF